MKSRKSLLTLFAIQYLLASCSSTTFGNLIKENKSQCMDAELAMRVHLDLLRRNEQQRNEYEEEICGDAYTIEFTQMNSGIRFTRVSQPIKETVITFNYVMKNCKKNSLNGSRPFVSVYRHETEKCSFGFAWDAEMKSI